ncbi:hypothetical protein N568_0108875 [Lactococcus garvieae TRF1]|uniref:Uncharacterized protein n=1 Tax=Lactococcus garvieae TRF1 TaxID=1380772 RepID=V8ANN3_9LACT|nr:hypothetical protein N568_0108875 [Lactococcus garvieae TRF1]
MAFLCIFFSILRGNAPTYPTGLCVWTVLFTHQKKEKASLYSFS